MCESVRGGCDGEVGEEVIRIIPARRTEKHDVRRYQSQELKKNDKRCAEPLPFRPRETILILTLTTSRA